MIDWLLGCCCLQIEIKLNFNFQFRQFLSESMCVSLFGHSLSNQYYDCKLNRTQFSWIFFYLSWQMYNPIYRCASAQSDFAWMCFFLFNRFETSVLNGCSIASRIWAESSTWNFRWYFRMTYMVSIKFNARHRQVGTDSVQRRSHAINLMLAIFKDRSRCENSRKTSLSWSFNAEKSPIFLSSL